MSNALLQYMLDLAEDPLRTRRFSASPDDELARADLTADDKAILRSRDAARIRAALVEPPPEGDMVLLEWLASLCGDAAEPEA